MSLNGEMIFMPEIIVLIESMTKFNTGLTAPMILPISPMTVDTTVPITLTAAPMTAPILGANHLTTSQNAMNDSLLSSMTFRILSNVPRIALKIGVAISLTMFATSLIV